MSFDFDNNEADVDPLTPRHLIMGHLPPDEATENPILAAIIAPLEKSGEPRDRALIAALEMGYSSQRQFGWQNDRLIEILTQATLTNGRVTELEKITKPWKAVGWGLKKLWALWLAIAALAIGGLVHSFFDWIFKAN